MDNEQIVRRAYERAEKVDIKGWVECFTMHRELYRFFSIGDVVVVELAFRGTHKGPLSTPMGVLPPTGKRMDAQLGVLSNIDAAIAHS